MGKQGAAFVTLERFLTLVYEHVLFEVAIFISSIPAASRITNEFFRSIIINSAVLVWFRPASNRVLTSHVDDAAGTGVCIRSNRM